MGLLDYIKANTPRATRPVANPLTVINQGLLNPNQYNAPAANRFKDSMFGLLGIVPGVGDAASAAESADLFNRGENVAGSMAALGALPLVPSLGGLFAHTVYHGSPHKFTKFDMSKIGTGEGKQQQGVGLYFAESKDVGQRYADRLADMHGKAEGNLYKVDLPDDAVSKFANYETSFMQQPESVRNAVAPLITDDVMHNLNGYYGWDSIDDAPMAAIMGALDISNGNSREVVTDLFKKNGIPGIRYLDGMSRGKGGTSNFVLFDDQLPRILEINGQPTGLKPWAEDARGLLDGPAMSKADEAGGLLGKVDNAPMGKQFNWDNPGGGIRTVKVGDTTIDYGFDGKSAHIASLRTPAAKRNKGSARAAMEQFLREADELGIPVKLESSPLDKKTKDLRLFNFYKSLGFEPTGKKINAVGDPEMIRKPKGPRILEINGQPTGLLSYADEAAQAAKKDGGLLNVNQTQNVKDFADQVKQKYGLKAFDVYEGNSGNLKLQMFEVPKEMRKQGIGTKAMQELVDYADSTGKKLTLSPGLPDDRHGTTSRARLVKFYKKFGFVENKGRNKDFTISEGMIREPKNAAK